MRNHWRTACLVFFALLGGCSTNIVQVSPDTYLAAKTSGAGAFTNMSSLKADVIRDANTFAASKGMVAIPLAADVLRPGIGMPSYEYQFRLVPPDHPDALRPAEASDIIIRKSEKETEKVKRDKEKKP